MSDTSVGTSKYMSPERLLCLPYNESADIFALGLILLEMLNNNVYPFGRSEGEDVNMITSPIDLLGEFENLDVNKLLDEYILPNAHFNIGISIELRDFLALILQYDPLARPSAL
jgi:serine/threonine protein kinase